MKRKLIFLCINLSNFAFSQIIIGSHLGTANDNSSVLLDFTPNENKGIILPYTRTLPSGAGLVEGTLLLDVSDPAKAKVKYYNGEWKDLSSGNEANITTEMEKQPSSSITEDRSKGVIIGSGSSSADGVLILESDNKAMILPIVADTDDIKDPAPGMMVYINKTGAKRLAVFNGSKWTNGKS